ncbi:MAG TPA: alpha/beta fold hydrolase [Gemmataceae bacterium]|nr:alpha/beta fold hydrolase [Gemmataceae bacterium]
MKILFLHGWTSTPGGVKPTYLAGGGHEILNPALPDDDFEEAVRIAQAEVERHHPDVIVGSSRGGAVAMNVRAGATPLVLLCPAWKHWGAERRVKPGTIILHSEADDVIPIADSRELLRNSLLPESGLVIVGRDHRLADPEPLRALLTAVERAGRPGTDEEPQRMSLYERLGGVYAIAAVIDDFIERIMNDPRLNANPAVNEAHHKVSRAGFKYLVTEQVCQATGGPQRYTGRSMYDSHVHLALSEGEWQAFLDDLGQTLDKFQVPPAEKAEIFAIVASTKSDIVLPPKSAQR